MGAAVGSGKHKTRLRDVVVVAGLRTPLGKVGGAFDRLGAVELGSMAMRELLARSAVSAEDVDQVIIGNVIQPAEAANIARVIALTAGIPQQVPAHTVHRNCASGMQAITDAAEKIQLGRADVVLAGGVESMTHAPLLFDDRFRAAMAKWPRARTLSKKITTLAELARAPWKPRIALLEGLTDPTVGMGMGQTAEILAREFAVTRAEQDAYALMSHQRADGSWNDGWYDDEAMHLFAPPSFADVHRDEGIRAAQTMVALAKLKPAFDRPLGTVTAGNSSQITDGAAMLVLSHREKAEAEGWPIMGYLHDWAYTGCDPARMGLGPVFATQRLLASSGHSMSDISRMEINEAFAVQVLACLKAMDSAAFAAEKLGGSALGVPDMDRLNVHGGAIAMGHPVGVTGARLVLTLLRQLQRDTGGGLAIGTLCIGGGQGGAVLLGSEPCKS
ncbi:MAG: acetyl-CoA C-acyltransferase [Zetaproteobacteria bacterium CG12_big_fil_rev_8_21_14_0_65_54_13]|nr:MAG: acetyl-CoA C-acyltransferase [Zetaproteobacteria bacterium CG12_big_fil_rev_8_21_14_0_65_54_13]PIX53320.1 MAG: acetyl-CoA C-acyltransferase [Zetaproteobacteria bacterium CG_4_10_14_3_um_filter_54_28]PJA29616.1 MAG: acetyl-CoA C-acyltransferase [Zetaproteobacteria bacterium CG_4_9_14_3_um_filter_54_145]